MDILTAIHTRRSVRRFTSDPVSEADLEVLLRAAMQAPSADNGQPWHFIVINDREIMNTIPSIHPWSEILAARLRRRDREHLTGRARHWSGRGLVGDCSGCAAHGGFFCFGGPAGRSATDVPYRRRASRARISARRPLRPGEGALQPLVERFYWQANSRSAGMAARKALARWLSWFFCSSGSSAIVLFVPATRNIGS